MAQKTILYSIIAFFLSAILLFVGFQPKNTEPKDVYRVYLAGKSIGLIESKQELEDYIDKEQEALKKKYKVDKIYPPTDLDIVKETTFNGKISSTQTIYNKIKDISPFTISGYTITIKGVEVNSEGEDKTTSPTEYIYVLDKKIFTTSVDKTIRSFVPSEEYDDFLNETQEPIKDTGKIIEDLYIENDITIKKENISVNNQIFLTEEELSKYLLFGTLEDQQKYIVKEGDTIEDVAYDNKISAEEFLIANPQFKDKDALLFPGQEVTLGILQPKFQTVEEDHKVVLQEKKYTTEVRYDNNMLIGTTKVLQAGQNGLDRITQKVKLINGETKTAIIASSEEVKPAVNEIIVKGGKSSYFGDVGIWGWPTKTPYTLTSFVGWRWGAFHDGLDIAGTGYGSPIMAANNGTVVVSGYTGINGNYVTIDHHNGYYTLYAHLSERYVTEGMQVQMGDIIGAMGNSGYAFGTHLHFSIWRGYPYRNGSTVMNPLNFYR